MNIMWMARENYEDLKEFKERNRNKYRLQVKALNI